MTNKPPTVAAKALMVVKKTARYGCLSSSRILYISYKIMNTHVFHGGDGDDGDDDGPC